MDFDNRSNPLVSICCMTYNHEKYIRECLDGFVKQQTNFEFEILVQDDASPDGTEVIVKEYETKYPDLFRCVYQTENQYYKQNTLANILFPMSRGKYIAFCEGDDYWTDSTKLQKQVDFLEENPDYGMVHTDADVLFQNTGVVINRKNFTDGWKIPDGEIYDTLLRGIFIKTLTVLMRKEIVGRFYKTIDYNRWSIGDFPLFLFISANSKVKYFNYSTGVYRLLKKSATHQQSLIERGSFFRGLYDIELFFADHYGCSSETRKCIMRTFNERKIEIGFYELKKEISSEGFDYLIQNKILSFRYFLLYLGSRNYILRKAIAQLLNIKKIGRIVLRQN